MTHARLRFGVQQLLVHGMPAHRLQGEWSNKLGGGVGHYHADIGITIAQATHQLGAFISGDPTRDSNENLFVA